MKKVLCTQKIRQEALDLLTDKAEVIIAPDPSEATVGELLKEAHGVILRTTSHITSKMIRSAPHLQVISRTGVGIDNIDIDAASQCGVLICNLPGLNTISAAEHAVSLILAAAKALPFLHHGVQSGNWRARNAYRPVELGGKTLGLVGVGRIGSQVAKTMHNGFNMRIIAYDPYIGENFPLANHIAICSLEKVMGESDFISLHVPAGNETAGLISGDLIAHMKPTAFLINTARGSVVDEPVLIDALRKGKIAGAGLDVFQREPLPTEHPFCAMDNVILSPHAAALTQECVVNAATMAAQAVLDVFLGKAPQHIANKAQLRNSRL